MNERSHSHGALLLLGVILVTVILSWLLSVLGADVTNLLSPEGIRWLFRGHHSPGMPTRGEFLFLLATVCGAAERSGFLHGLRACLPLRAASPQRFSLRARLALLLSLVLLAVSFGFLFLMLSLSSSPLRSATGELWPRSFTHGFMAVSAFIFVATAAVYGATSRRLRTLSDFSSLLYCGVQRFAPYLVMWYLGELWVQMLLHVLRL